MICLQSHPFQPSVPQPFSHATVINFPLQTTNCSNFEWDLYHKVGRIGGMVVTVRCSNNPNNRKQTGIMDETFNPFPSLPDGYFYQYYDRRWPAWKFGMRQEELFTTIAKQFNSITIPMLDLEAFNRDVCEMSVLARDKDDFFKLLGERRDMRLRELHKLWLGTFCHIATYPAVVPELKPWTHAMQIFHTQSFDSYVRYFAGFLPTEPAQQTLPKPSDGATIPTPSPTDSSVETLASSEPIEANPSEHEDRPGGAKPSRAASKSRRKPTSFRSHDNRVEKRTSQEGKPRRSLRIRERCSKGDVATQRTRHAISSKASSKSATVRRERRARPR
ncbi:hypothetical protein GGR51DRAFT_540985 [Nemania sp. FL0031]|nr:hypothetical protein GGR51DRAFT_540985 [Nemania sp. FL0031]